MRFTTTFTLTKKEFQKLKDIRSGEYDIWQGTIDKLTNLKLITESNRGFSKIYKVTKLGKEIIDSQTFKRGDVVVFSNALPEQYKIVAVTDNHLCNGRAYICEMNDTESFDARRGTGMPIKYLKKVQ